MIALCSSSVLTWTLPTSITLFITMANFAMPLDEDHADFMKFLLDSAIESILQSHQRAKITNKDKVETKRRYSLPYRRQPVRYSRRQPKGKIPFRHYQRSEDYYGWYPHYVPMTMMPPTTPPQTTEQPTEPPPPPPPTLGTKSNKALLAVVAPLALLASLGPLLAAQVMIPWAVAGSSSGGDDSGDSDNKRTKRWLTPVSKKWALPPATARRRSSEVKRAVLKLQMIRDYLNEVDQQRSHRDDIMASYLECRGFTDPGDHCLERLACEFADPNNSVISIEREVMAMVIYNIMNNEKVDDDVKGRMKKAAIFGYKNSGHCVFYWCYKVDKNDSPSIDIN